MKKLFTIFFLGIYLFSVVGYRGLFNLVDQSISQNIIEKLDHGDYNDDALIEIKMPYPMLYANNWTEYQRFDGEVEMNGVHYNYVKRKLRNDTLYLLCIPNHDKTKLAAQQIDYVKNSSDLTDTNGTKKSSSNSVNKSFTWEHISLAANDAPASPILARAITNSSRQYSLPSVFISSAFQPPKC